jgi:succinate dehydrogenase hydrophobic anchor subunit
MGKLKELWQREEGIATVEWIGLTGVILVFLTVIIVYFQTQGGREVGQAVADSFKHQVELWDKPLFW